MYTGWERSEDASFGYKALDTLAVRFQIPLEKAQVDCSQLQEEWNDIVDYAKRYLNIVQEDYTIIWWKLFNSVDSKNWMNILSLVELLFCLPMSNGRIKRLFSQLKLIKSDRHSCICEDRIDQLMRISVEGPPLSQWDSTGAVDLWWKDKIRRVPKNDYHKTSTSESKSTNHQELDSDNVTIEDWDTWLNIEED